MGFWSNIGNKIIKSMLGSQEYSMLELAEKKMNFSDYHKETLFFLTDVSPSFSLDTIPLIRKLVLSSPELSQAVKRSIMLGNSGLEWEVEAKDGQVEAIIQEIESFFNTHKGITNHLFRQILITGALSAEFVPFLNLDGVQEVRTISVEKIRFREETSEIGTTSYVPYEKTKSGFNRLNLEQYSYEALEKDEDSPYAIPPFLSAIRWVYSQFQAQDSTDKNLNKWGLLGFIVAKFKKPRLMPGMDEESYRNRSEDHLKLAKASFEKNSQSGFMATFDDTTIEHHTLSDASKTGGYESIWRSIGEQIASGIDTDLFILGRSYSVTESYAKIAGKLFLLKQGNIRHPVKRFLERVIRWHLLARGYKFQSVDANWRTGISLDPKADADTKKINLESNKIHWELIYDQVMKGLLSPVDGAKELGLESWYDETKLSPQSPVPFDFKKKNNPEWNNNQDQMEKLFESHRYPDWIRGSHNYTQDNDFEYPHNVHSSNLYGCKCDNLQNFVQLGFWTPDERKIYEAIENGFAKNFFNTYNERVKSVLDTLSQKNLKSDEALDIIWKEIESELGEKFPKQIRDNWKKAIQDSWNHGQDYNNPSSKEKVSRAQANKNVIDFINRDFQFSIGKQFYRASDSSKINEAIQLALAEGSTERVIQRLENILQQDVGFDKSIKDKLDYIVRGNILRVRNFSRIERFEAVGITKLEIVAIEDNKTSAICRAMNGKEIEVRKAVEFVKEFTSDDPTRDGFWDKYSNKNVSDLFWESGNTAFDVLKNRLPPYHPRCRTTIVAGGTTVVTRRTNSGRETELEGSVEKPSNASKPRKELNNSAFNMMNQLEKSELVNRIDNVISRADWKSDEVNLTKHWDKHGQEFSSIGINSKNEYRNLSLRALKNFSNLFGYIYEKDNKFKFGFEIRYKSNKLLTVVNPVTMEIDSFMILDYKYKYPRIF